MNKPYAVVLGLEGATPIGIIKSLGYEKIPVIGAGTIKDNLPAANSRYLESPPIITKNEETLLKELIDFGQNQHSKGVLFPSGDEQIVFCSKYIKELERYYAVPKTKIGKLENLLDKNVNNSLGEGAGFNIPWSGYLSEIGSYHSGPVIIKPVTSVGTSKRDMKIYESFEDLLIDKEKLLEKFGELVVQEYIPGGCRNLVEIHAYHGSKGTTISGMQRNMFSREMNKEVFGGIVFQTIWDEKLVPLAGKLMENLQFNGPVDINLKQSSHNGKYYFMEFNPRSSSNTLLDTKAGLNLPAIVFNDQTGQNFDYLLGKDLEIGTNWLWEQSLQSHLQQGNSSNEIVKFLKGKKIVRALHSEEDPKTFEEDKFDNKVKEILEEIK